MSGLKLNYATVASTLALVVALTGVGAYAAGIAPNSVGTPQLKNDAVTSAKIHARGVGPTDLAPRSVGVRAIKPRSVGAGALANGSVRAASISTGAVGPSALATDSVGSAALADASVASPNIQAGAVTAASLSLPAPDQLENPSLAQANFEPSFAKLATLGTYDKQDPSSVLQVNWSGTAQAGFSPCVFQLRIDGTGAGGDAGSVYVQNSVTASVASSAQFSGFDVGKHSVEIWAKAINAGGYPCTLSPASTGIGQSVTVQEVVS